MDDLKKIGFALDRLYQRLGRHYASLSRPQRRFLHAIAVADGIGVTTLSETFEMTVAGATRMLDKLESAGWIERRRQVDDARHVNVFLTENGLHALAQADEVYRSRLKDLLSSFSPDELHALHQLLLKIDHNAHQ